MSRRAARRVCDRLEEGLAALAVTHPRLTLAAAGALGHLRNRLSRRWPRAAQVRALFPELPSGAAARAAWRIAAGEARNRVLTGCLRRAGLAPVRALLRGGPELGRLRPPLLLGTFHVGAVHALGPALEELPAPVIALRHGPLFTASAALRVETTEGDEQGRAAVFQGALAHLQDGGFVATALDVAPGAALAVPCLGRTLRLARGPFALARLAGVPLVPLAARWRRGGVEVALGEPLAAGTEDSLAAAAAARWLERYLRAAPGELGLGLLRALLAGEVSGADAPQ